MKILVTGGAGFIASHVTDLFCAEGHEVLVVDNLSTGQEAFVNPKATLVKADICDREKITQIITEFKPEVIDHHAAHIMVGHSVVDPQFDAENNIIALLNIMQAAKDNGVKKVIMASTGGAMYGNKPVPFTEELKEEPVSPYGVSKRSGELYLNYYKEQYGIPYIALRYGNVFGPRQNPHGESGVVAIFSEYFHQGKVPTINGDGTHTRDYVYVTDVARANLLALQSNETGAFNIGTNTAQSTNQVYDRVAQEFGHSEPAVHGPERPGEQVASQLDYSKAKRVLGWEPQINFDQGVTEVVKWYREQK
jgi:UDP-glucose 4-epimerase